jgi:two-component system, OmpR family, response regulator
MRILVVEDDKDVGAFVVRGLKEAGHVVEHADNGRDGLFMAASEAFDAVVLDRMLPGGIDGLRLLETLRAQKNTVPVLILSALADVDERVRGLKAGGDDYLTKPFQLDEVRVRLDALLRRTPPCAPGEVAEGPVLDPARHALVHGDQEVSLTPTEFRLLGRLMAEPSTVVRRHALVAAAWPMGAMVSDNTLDSYVRRLRTKLGPLDLALITTVRGVGYRWQ